MTDVGNFALQIAAPFYLTYTRMLARWLLFGLLATSACAQSDDDAGLYYGILEELNMRIVATYRISCCERESWASTINCPSGTKA